MRPVVVFLAVIGVAILAWLWFARPKNTRHNAPVQEALAVSKHSDSFNHSVSGILNVYAQVAEGFVKWDSVAVRDLATDMNVRFNDLKIDELKKDSSGIYETAASFVENAKGELQTISDARNIRPQREAFNNLTDDLRQFLNTVKYDREKLYLQECPMAFDDTKPGQWLSKNEEIRNPYMGLHHPRYGNAMITCGETKQTIDHTGRD